jgi:CubicO group peptidase (beta-lactamase class C family)
MKLALKIILIAVVLIAGAIIWIWNANKVTPLEIKAEDSQAVKLEKTDAWLKQMHEKNKFNGGVLLIKNGEVIFKKTYGYTDHTRSKKLTSSSAFRLASVSKQFTAAGIMVLKEQGKLDFDDSITEYFPELPYQGATIRQLLNHTSGIPDAYMDFPMKFKEEIGEELQISEVVSLLAKANLPFEAKPNERFQYSNTGYVLLAAIIERISSNSFEEFMRRELFKPLGMKNTRVWNLVSPETTFENKTGSFDNFLGAITELPPTVFDGLSGDGGIFSSLDDFIIWNQFWTENALFSKETMQEAFKKPILTNGVESDYGFGWTVTPNGGVWHNGSWLGARTLIARNEGSKNCMVILDNSSSQHVDDMGQQLASVLAD